MKNPVVLRIYKGDQLSGVKQFLDGQIVFGNQPDVQVSLNDDKVALIHAAIEERDGSWYVCDLGSETGTYRNGEAILDARLETGDLIQIGDFRIEFYIGVPKPKAAPQSTVGSAGTATNVPVETGTNIAINTVTNIPSGTVVFEQQSAPAVESVAPPVEVVAPTPQSQSVAQTQAEAPQAAAPTAEPQAEAKPEPKAASETPMEGQAPVQAEEKPRVPASQPLPSAAKAPALPISSGGGGGMQVDPYKIEAPPIMASADPAAATIRIGGAAAAVGPEILKGSTSEKRKHGKKRGNKTFAPASRYQSFREFVKPSKGTVVEVLVLWRERVINAFHFSNKAVVTMGSHPDCDIVLPVARQRKVPILKIDARAVIMVTPELTGELIKGQQSSNFSELLRQNRLLKDRNAYALVLEQGEMVRLEMSDSVSVIVRYTSDSPKPIPAPMFDLTAAEATGIAMAVLLVGVIWLYNQIASPVPINPDGLGDEPMRTAVIEIETMKVPPPPPPPVEIKPEEPKPQPTPPPQVVKSTPVPKKVEQEKPKQVMAKNPEPKKNPGTAANVAPNKNKTGPRTQTSVKQGGAVKTGNTGGAQAKSQRRDVEKSGVFSVFGGGRQDKLDSSYSGAGELSGFADSATGRAGQTENRAGDGIGTPFKDTGKGGTGTAAVGVSGGVATRGRGSGASGYGTGGLGTRKGVQIVPGGTEESFSGTIDKEAIRRVVMANIRAIKTCYEKELNRNPDLFGKLVIEWVIGEQGRVMSARVKSSELGNQRVGECVRSIIRAARFPEPPTNEEVTVAYPFMFSN